MIELIVHELPRRAAELTSRLRETLLSSTTPEVGGLAARAHLPQAERPRLVLTGQYNSGKSSLIKALTHGAAQVVIASDPATDVVTEYDWDGLVTLIDTPGVGAGFDTHDQLAEEALAAADLVLFALTIELFDDTGAAHLRHVLNELGKHRQTLVVFNKYLDFEQSEDIRQEALAVACGAGQVPPSVTCAARSYLQALASTDPAKAQVLRDESRIDVLRDAINDLARKSGQAAQLRAPFQLIRALVDEATAAEASDEDQRAALLVLARQRSALTQRRERIYAVLDQRRLRFLGEAETAAGRFADLVEQFDASPEASRASQIDTAQTELQQALESSYTRYREDVVHLLDAQLDDLASQVLEIEQGPAARRLMQLADEVVDLPDDPRVTWPGDWAARPDDARRHPDMQAWMRRALEANKMFADFWGAGEGVKASAGSAGHQIVLDVGHLFGKKFQPWEAVRFANNVGRVSKLVGPAIQVGMAAAEVAAQERALVAAEQDRFRRRQDLVAEVRRQCEELIAEGRKHIDGVLEPAFSESLDEIDTTVGELQEDLAARSSLAAQLSSIRREADEALLLADDQLHQGSVGASNSD